MFCALFYFILLFVSSLQDNSTNKPTNFNQTLIDNHISPDLIPWEKVPDEICQIRYKNNVKIVPGIILNQTYVIKTKPEVHWKAEPKSFYTLYHIIASTYLWDDYGNMTYPPPPPIYYKTELIKWMVYNIPGSNVESGKTMYTFSPPKQPNPDFNIPYIFLIFKQPDKMEFNTTNEYRYTPRPGDHWYTPLRIFFKNFNFTLVAMNFFVYEFDYWTQFTTIPYYTLVPKKFYKIEYQTAMRQDIEK